MGDKKLGASFQVTDSICLGIPSPEENAIRNAVRVNVLWILMGILMFFIYYDTFSASMFVYQYSVYQSITGIIEWKYFFSLNYTAAGMILAISAKHNSRIFKLAKIALIAMSGMPLIFSATQFVGKAPYDEFKLGSMVFFLLYFLQIKCHHKLLKVAHGETKRTTTVAVMGLATAVLAFQASNAINYLLINPNHPYWQLWP